ncbi:MAG: glucosaminidase domain-containing protein [Deltaproteobacteria bacterium]|nr:glucosaminidase domain-containing protein [Deltaproteobacteria bacterium]
MEKKILLPAGLTAVILLFLLYQPVVRKQPGHQPWEAPEPEPETLTLQSPREIWDYYESLGYTRDELESGDFEVPRIYLGTIGDNWAKDESVAARKSLFYRTMLPLVLRVNEQITAERNHLQFLADRYREGDHPGREDLAWLENLAQRYKVLRETESVDVTEEFFRKIYLRVDTIPVSMALGQMAYESGYATSRFTGQGNALFGQRCWGDDGMMPDDKGGYRIADFPTLIDSIKAYAMNINTHEAYTNFRLARAEQRREKKNFLDGYSLVATLDLYSEKGQEYIETLQGIIGQNELTIFDDAKLSKRRPVTLVQN